MIPLFHQKYNEFIPPPRNFLRLPHVWLLSFFWVGNSGGSPAPPASRRFFPTECTWYCKRFVRSKESKQFVRSTPVCRCRTLRRWLLGNCDGGTLKGALPWKDPTNPLKVTFNFHNLWIFWFNGLYLGYYVTQQMQAMATHDLFPCVFQVWFSENIVFFSWIFGYTISCSTNSVSHINQGSFPRVFAIKPRKKKLMNQFGAKGTASSLVTNECRSSRSLWGLGGCSNSWQSEHWEDISQMVHVWNVYPHFGL